MYDYQQEQKVLDLITKKAVFTIKNINQKKMEKKSDRLNKSIKKLNK